MRHIALLILLAVLGTAVFAQAFPAWAAPASSQNNGASTRQAQGTSGGRTAPVKVTPQTPPTKNTGQTSPNKGSAQSENPAQTVPATGKTSAKQPAQPQATAAQKQAAALVTLEERFETLAGDPQKNKLRDNWLKLEESFTALAAKSSGETAAKAAFLQARCREELGARSYMSSDRKKAVELFAAMAKKYPKSPLAPEALYRQAAILGVPLKNTAQAAFVLAALEKNYPDSPEAAKASGLAASFPAGAGNKGTGNAASSGAAGTTSGGKDAKKAGSASVLEQLGLTVKTIMLDAGHGGKDPGCMANGLTEKAFTLAMAKRIGGLLEKKGYTVLYSRGDDTFITLPDRPDMANKHNVDLFISIHLNANPSSEIYGLETYYLDSAKTKDAAKVAARENAVSVQEISDLQFILTDLMLTSKVKESKSLAGCVQKAVMSSLRKGKQSTIDHGVRSAPFYVLVGARMPAILVEFGYATNAKEAVNLKDSTYLDRQAQGVVDGIAAYKDQLAKIAEK